MKLHTGLECYSVCVYSTGYKVDIGGTQAGQMMR